MGSHPLFIEISRNPPNQLQVGSRNSSDPTIGRPTDRPL